MPTDPEAKSTPTPRHGDTDVSLAEIQRLDGILAELRHAAGRLLEELDEIDQTRFPIALHDAIDRLAVELPAPGTPASNEVLASIDAPRRK